MIFQRGLLFLALLSLLGFADASYASERSHGMVTKAERALRGTWYSATGSITFKENGTIKYKGKRYYYAVSNGGYIQLSGKNSEKTIPYQLFGDKLTLIENGKSIIYSRKR